jgi:integrase
MDDVEGEAMEPVFPTFDPAQAARMLKADLKTANIDYKDSDGKYADFHSLRHTFITLLARSGVHPKTAQDLARHSTYNAHTGQVTATQC